MAVLHKRHSWATMTYFHHKITLLSPKYLVRHCVQCTVKCNLGAQIQTELMLGNKMRRSRCSEHVLETSAGCLVSGLKKALLSKSSLTQKSFLLFVCSWPIKISLDPDCFEASIFNIDIRQYTNRLSYR